MIKIRGNIVTPSAICKETIAVSNGRIISIADDKKSEGEFYDFGDAWILPGFIDVHMHGLHEFGMANAKDIIKVAQIEPSYGTTSVLPTAFCLSAEKYCEFGYNAIAARQEKGENAARIPGVHFEGPFINPERKAGMNADYLRPVNLDECRQYLDCLGNMLKIMVISPELAGSVDVIKYLCSHHIVVSLGHSNATDRELEAAQAVGLSHVCHLFNAFERTNLIDGWRWKPGLIDAILASDNLTCEVICDMFHVLPEFIKLAAKLLGPDRFVAITDCMPGTGLNPGEYILPDGRKYTTRDAVARLVPDGTVMGSILTMNKALRNLVEVCGFDIVTASKFTSTNPARVIGYDKIIGSIEVGKMADIAVLDDEFNCICTFIEGRKVYKR
jgi:N-acetylglucosamine-6-phosphate deacetylase